MKKIILIIVLILICFIVSGCNVSSSTATPDGSTLYGTCMIIMPDGTIIKGKCEDYERYSNNWIQVKIDGITYRMNDWRVTIYK